MSQEKILLKDTLMNESRIKSMALKIKSVYALFDQKKFLDIILSELENLELKQRISHITAALRICLPEDYDQATDVLIHCAKIVGEDGGFVYASFCEYVEEYGCSDANYLKSLDLLGELTQVFSAEFAIRTYLNKYPEETFNKMMTWSRSHNVHKRRLASEGLRPKLPWGKNINFDYLRAMEPLDNLFYDSERYVVRSVANHLNDVSKVNGDLVVETLKRWEKTEKQSDNEMMYLKHHALRTAIKRGHENTLSFLGFDPEPEIQLKDFYIKNTNLNIGQALEFCFSIKALKKVSLMVDYKIEYPMANNKRTTKVFKIKKCQLKADQVLKIEKSHVFKMMTTKKLYSGRYNIRLQINGHLYNEAEFHLNVT